MKIEFILLIILIIGGCKSNDEKSSISKFQLPKTRIELPQTKEDEFSFYVLDNIPIYEDQYMFSPIVKKFIKYSDELIDWYLIDWNENGKYDEIEIDYIGVKNKFDENPYIIKLDDIIYINYHGKTYFTSKENGFTKVKVFPKFVNTKLSLLDKIVPIELEDGKIYDPKIKNDTLVLYFWATWCAPCIEKIKLANKNIANLNRSNIKFVPIAYKCSGIKEYFKKNNINFEPYIANENTGNNYELSTLSKTFVFDENGKLINNHININYE